VQRKFGRAGVAFTPDPMQKGKKTGRRSDSTPALLLLFQAHRIYF
jgi:hypothetical protein